MKWSTSHIVTYSLLAVTSILAIYFYLQTQKLKNEDTSEVVSETVEQKNDLYSAIWHADSLLFQGQYDKALVIYQRQLSIKDDNLALGLASRIAIVNALMEGKEQPEVTKNDKTNSGLNPDSGPTAEEIRKYDSLNFALAKAQLQIKNLIGQLRANTGGSYLTFTTRKGIEVHYVGSVKDNMAHGRGVALLNTGSRYEGEWKGNQRHGQGTFWWPDGHYYEGTYKEDHRHGIGTYYWPNGQRFTGQWEDDKRSGEGVFYADNGTVLVKGVWRNDELVQVSKD